MRATKLTLSMLLGFDRDSAVRLQLNRVERRCPRSFLISRRSLLVAAAAALLLVGLSPAHAQILTINAANSPYTVNANATYISVFVGGSSNGVLNHSANTLTTTNLALGDNTGVNGSYNLSGTGTLSSDHELIGYNGTGTFTQSGGTNTVNSFLYLGENAGSSGTYNLSGGALSAPNEFIGDNGNGTFNHTGGTHTVSGFGSTLYLGEFAGSIGNYTLSGTGALSAGRQFIGNRGTGTFTQNGGTSTVSGDLFLGINGGSIGRYNLNGGTLTPNLVSGNGGTSTFNFNGGTLRARSASTFFVQNLTRANVRVGGAKIDTNGFNVTVAQNLLHDNSGGAPAIDGGLIKSGAGTLTLTGTNTYTGPTTISAGTLLAQNAAGTATGSGAVSVDNGGKLGGSGSVGPVTVASGGTVAPGNSPGRLTVNGNYTQNSGGALAIELGGAAPVSQYDQLAVTGQATISGTLNVTLVNGFQPAPGATFQILTSGSAVVGSFSSITSPGGVTVRVDPNAQGLVLTVLGSGPAVSSAVSRKVHGTSGEFSIPLPLTGPVGVECRAAGGGGSHQVVVTFVDPVSVGGAFVTSADGLATISGNPGGTVITLNLGNVTNAQNLMIRLANVNNGSVVGDVFIPMGVLAGDTNSSRGVNATDIGQTKAASGQNVGASNFRADANFSGGSINASDIGLVKANSGSSLP